MAPSESNSLPARRLGDCIDLFRHWDDGFWSAVNVFLVTEGLLVAGAAPIFTIAGPSLRPLGAALLGLVGLAFSLGWMLVLNRKSLYVWWAWQQINALAPEFSMPPGLRPSILTRYSSGRLMRTGFPAAFACLWTLVLLFAALWFFR
jgi:hypothetical protein